MVDSGADGTRPQRAIHALTPLLVNLAIGLSLRLAMPYTLVDSGERYRYYAMSLFFPIRDCPSFHCFRILPPLLTSLLPFEVIDSFVVTGFVLQVLAAVMLWLIAERLQQSRRVAVYAVAWYWVTWAPMQTFGDPLLITDPVAAFWSLSALYLLLDQRFVLALLVLVPGAAVKESILLVPLIYAVYTFLAKDPARRRIVWLMTLVAGPIIAWLLLRLSLSHWFGYVVYQDERYVRDTYFFGLWLPNLSVFPRNLLIAAVYIFGACGAAWILGPLGLRHASRPQRALSCAALPAMVFLALYQVPDRALASFPYATLVPAALVLARLPSWLSVALLVASAAFSIRMNTAVLWVPRIPITIVLIAVLTVLAMWLDGRMRGRPASPAVVLTRPPEPAVGWAVAIAIVALLGAVSLHAWRINADHQSFNWSLASSPFLVDDEGNTPAFALSPDGQWVAFVASDWKDAGATRRLWRRGVGASSSTALVGTDGAGGPFWSPDGRCVAFFAQGKLKSLDLASGAVTVLADAPMAHGGAWSARGVIVFAPDLTGALYQVPSTGGPATAATRLDHVHDERSHRWPTFLPDGRHFVFAARGDRDAALYVAELGSAAIDRIAGDNANAVYSGPGFLLLGRDDGVWMQPFDAKRLRPFGDRYRLATAAFDAATGRGAFAAVDRLVIVARPRREPVVEPRSHLQWVDEQGHSLGSTSSPEMPAHVDLSHDAPATSVERVADGGIVTSRSPDGRVLLYQKRVRKTPDALPGAWSVWIQPLTRGAHAVPLRDDGSNHVQAQFSPDGRWIAYASNESRADEVYVQPYPPTGERWQVSIDGGAQPRWRSDRELVYVADDRFVRTAAIDTHQGFQAGPPRPLFELPLRPVDLTTRLFEFAIASDGGRFLVNVADVPPEPAPVTMVFGWRSGPTRQ